MEPSPNPTRYKKYSFTYRFEGADCCIEIPALSLEEAKQRLQVIGFARYDGAPPQPLAAARKRRSSSWFRNALNPAT